MKHIIAYAGKGQVSLGLLQEGYGQHFVPWANQRIDIEGTNLRPPYSPAHFSEWVRRLDQEKGKNEVFAVLVQKKVGRNISYQYVGHMGLHHIQWPEGYAVSGSVIGAANARGLGIGTEAKLLLLYHAFKVLGLRKVISNVKAFNYQSAAHLLKCGYQLVGKYEKHVLQEGKLIGQLLFEVFPGEWQTLWNRYQVTGTLPHLNDDQRLVLKRNIVDL